jgi:VWFA-related protein
MRFSAAAVGAMALVGSSVQLVSQDRSAAPPPTFRTGIDLVYVDVSVLDRDRRPVRGLQATDFVVREDGRTRPIAAFSAVDLPDSPAAAPVAWMREVPPDVVTNVVPREGRLVVILLDALPQHIPEAQRTAEAAVDQLGPGDLAAVVFAEVGTPQNFTADKRLLRDAVSRPYVRPDEDPDGQRGVCPCNVCGLNTIARVADAVRDVPRRRKMLLYIGSTLPGISTSIGCFAEVRKAREEVLQAAGLANLAIHTFDSNLLETLAPTAQRRDPPPLDRSGLVGAHLERQGNLMMYAGATGGRAIKNTNAPWEPMADVFAESGSYYVLGITPEGAKADGRQHKITVDVSRRDASVHSRRGYYAPMKPVAEPPRGKDAPSPSLVRALAGLWPETAMPLSVTAAAFAGDSKAASTVTVVLRAREPAVLGSARVSVLAGAYDRDGKALDEHLQTITVTPPRERATNELEYETIARLRLKPGRHEVRVAAEDAAHDLRGSVYTYVDVPDFANAPLSLSGIVLGATGAKPQNVLGDLLPVTPTAQRQFGSSRRITAFVRVYDTAGQESPVGMTARVVDGHGAVAFSQTATVRPQGSAPRSADYLLDLPLSTLAAGDYLLTIEAVREKHSVSRDLRFGVR